MLGVLYDDDDDTSELGNIIIIISSLTYLPHGSGFLCKAHNDRTGIPFDVNFPNKLTAIK